MKSLIIAFVFSVSLVHAETELQCWSLPRKPKTTPILTAQISANTQLLVSLNLKDTFFDKYTYSSSQNEGSFHEVGRPVQPTGILKPELIQSNQSPYKGNNEYRFVFAKTYWTSGENTHENNLEMRFILPTNLSNSFLQDYRIRSGHEKSNAVIMASAPRNSSERGHTYLRLFCSSK